MDDIPAQLGLNPDETKAYHSMNARERFDFNALPDNNAKIIYVRTMVSRDRTWRERSDVLFSDKIDYGGDFRANKAILLEKNDNPQAAVGAW
ncbi:19246_t:CDS:2, partial [Gigaspora margarita]